MATVDEMYGPATVPASTYPAISTFQMIGDVEWEGGPQDRPVMMRGSLRCRIATRGTARRYATAVLERHVRMLKITETDPVRWCVWMNRHLIRVARKRPWWSFRWQYAVVNDLRWLVCEYSVLIDGERLDIYEREHMQNVRKLARSARKLIGEPPALPARINPAKKTAINVHQN
jgi:hypothetical protein